MSITIIPPDTAGSKGDEAVIRGALNVFKGLSITLMTPGNKELSWKTELPDRAGEFDEVTISKDGNNVKMDDPCTLVIPGTDVIDGTGLKSSSLLRLKLVAENSMLGGKTAVFMSFRKNVDKEIIEIIKRIEKDKRGDILWTCRDNDSIINFRDQTGIEPSYFPDFAYYAESDETDRVKCICHYLNRKKEENKVVVGVNLSSHSFSSFYDYSPDNVKKYILSVIDTICEIEKNPIFVFVSHDLRKVIGAMSDYDFSCLASQITKNESIVLPNYLKYPELKSVIHEMDYIVTGRMHVSVSSFAQNVPSVLFTGKGRSSYSMVDKCYGMYEDRIGCKELVATNNEELKRALSLVSSQRKELKDRLLLKNELNEKEEGKCAEQLRMFLGLESKDLLKTAPTEYELLINAIRENVNGLRDEIGDISDRCTSVDYYCRKLNDYCDGLQYRIDQLEKEKDGLNDYCRKLNDYCDGLQYRIDQLEKTYDKIEKNKIKWLFGRLD